ncbi:MAG TPA: 50S ribosomal protein L23 [Candidatus Saccharimonadales bacterium]|nr:50S ribosomal protein L23 [Candidatus Saccharimonadales bacterium]
MLISPRMTEKAYATSADGTYVFNVPMSANKQTVAAELKDQFKVDATDVRFVVAKGKTRRTYRSSRKNPVVSVGKDKKKAYVRLAEGQSLDLFKSEDEEKK